MWQTRQQPAAARAADPQEWSALMLRAQAGDADAYRRLLHGVTPYVRAIASRAHRNPSDAEDTVQDVLLTTHAVRHTYDPARPFKPWLAGIARHRVVDRLRARSRIAAREVVLQTEHDGFAGEDADPDLALDLRVVEAGIRLLPDTQRQAITLLKLEELSLRDAAERTGLSIAALKTSTHRGIKALRRLLGGER